MASSYPDFAGPANPGRYAKPGNGLLHGGAHRSCEHDDVCVWLRTGRHGRGMHVANRQCWSEPRPELHRGLLHDRSFGRGWESRGDGVRVIGRGGHRSNSPTMARRCVGENHGAGCHHTVPPMAASRSFCYAQPEFGFVMWSSKPRMRRTFPKREFLIVAVLAFVGLVVLPCLNAFGPPNSALHVSAFNLSLYGKYLCYAVLAMGVNLIWGYTGLLSLGQCLFFALGGYALGMYLMLLIAKLGQYRGDLPDFMVFLEFPAKYAATGGLPRHWMPFHVFWFAAAAVVWVPALVAYVFGFLAFRSRIKGVYFSILSQTLTYAVCLMFFRNDFTFGGNNGLTDFKFILGTPVLTAGEIKDPPAFAKRLKDGGDAVSKFPAGQLSADTQNQLAHYSGGELPVTLQ